jgi:hypothetical protein
VVKGGMELDELFVRLVHRLEGETGVPSTVKRIELKGPAFDRLFFVLIQKMGPSVDVQTHVGIGDKFTFRGIEFVKVGK